jgi:hypothetical protein
VLANLDAPLILWSQDPAAGALISGRTMARKVISSIQDGDIILLHDSTEDNLEAACRIIDALQPLGYEFVTVEELFRLRGVTLEDGVIYKSAPPASQAYDGDLRDHWAWPELEALEKAGILSLDGASPNAYLTRAAAAELLWRAAGMPEASRSSGCWDVSSGAAYSQAAAWALETGVMESTGFGRFSPRDTVSRQQLYGMMARLPGVAALPETVEELPGYGDRTRIDPDYQAAVEAIEVRGFVSRNDRELFRPKDPATLAEAAELVCWYLS